MNSGCFVKGEHKSRDTEFKKGLIPWNKGLHIKLATNGFKKGMAPWNKNKTSKIAKICPTCNKEFRVFPSLRQQIYCSLKCKPSPYKGKYSSVETRKKQSLAKIGIRGSNHPLWRGGLNNTERSRVMQHIEYKQWRRSIFVRDIFTCKDCGKTQTYIEAHHIKSYKDYPKLRFDIGNGITLCVSCHKKRHSNRKEIKCLV